MQAERLGVAAPLPAAPVHEAQPSRLAVLVVPGQRLVERRDVQEVAGPHDILAAGEGRASGKIILGAWRASRLIVSWL